MPARKGTKPPNAGKGRKKGVPNKITRSVKDAFQAVFEDLQTDSKQPYHLAEWAKTQPVEFYKLAAKLIPAEIKGDLTHTHKVPGVEMVAAALGVPTKKTD